MERRAFLKLVALGVTSHTLDLDRLLWVPGAKKIFIPKPGLTESQIVAMEMERIIPKIRAMFERDDKFYEILSKENVTIIGENYQYPISYVREMDIIRSRGQRDD